MTFQLGFTIKNVSQLEGGRKDGGEGGGGGGRGGGVLVWYEIINRLTYTWLRYAMTTNSKNK